MFLKRWSVIAVLLLIGLAFWAYWYSLPRVPGGVTPQSGSEDWVKAIAALAGMITTLGGAVFGVLGKLNDYKKVKLEIAEKELEIARKQKELDKA